MEQFIPVIDETSGTPKFIQLVDSIEYAIRSNVLEMGDPLPSVNFLIKKCKLSRDTVFKAYSELKDRGLVESVPNKGYYVAREVSKVFLFLDTFKAYKEVLYGAFRKALPQGYSVDLHFHHYNIRVFEDIIRHSIGKYSHYIVMNFDHPDMKRIVGQIDPERLLIIDWNIHVQPNQSFVCQNFGSALYDNLVEHIGQVQKYQRFIYVYPEFTYHPKESIQYFQKFCDDEGITGEVLYDADALNPREGDLYLMVSDRTLAMLLDKASDRNLVVGQNLGIISYNDTPMKRFVKEGITVLTTDFNKMGEKAAEFVFSGNKMREVIDTKMVVRASL
ncbi:DNA-binding transcriptional regulator YhcF (GntR family) [Breznakibacter xylanolyticus]|uniref:DNA-binding transcriptional regulator YhcF (GntR family) n=1 Tax=Breznakibacter xylanolyticus TaxID=990 RepID=A0A2W7N6H5_9BACT|nr:GntR family transcriptional regulator [Breznakibacter xylanolyticus]PZX15313.1 DNA-binding transcriptional regulator YhcF (GntR family) [Breznakibacter xylanolyticus]